MSPLQALSSLIRGFFIGIANIIPGVSGGTMALVLGIYERLITAIGNINGQTIKIGLRLFTFKKQAIDDFVAEIKKTDAIFLTLITVGALTALKATASLMSFLLINWHDPTYGFFVGLILVSIIVPLKMQKSFKIKEAISLLVAIALTVGVTLSIDSGEKLKNAKLKHELKQAKAAEMATPSTESAVKTEQGTDHSPTRLGYIFLCASLAISAMILPGISGSFVLLLLGVYFDFLAAINTVDIYILSMFALGFGFGLVVFTRVLNFVFKHYYDPTISFLIGLMLGSLYGLWPFKTFEIVGPKRIDLDMIWPAMDANTALTAGTFIAGGVIVAIFLALDKRKETE